MAEAEEEDGGVTVALDMDARLIVAGEGAVKETIGTGMVMEDCVETLEGVEGAVLFRDGSADVVRALPTRQIALHHSPVLITQNCRCFHT